MPKQRRTFTAEFKKQLVQLYDNGRTRADIVKEYDLTASALDCWIKQAQTTGSFSEKDNRSPEENELIALRKEKQPRKMTPPKPLWTSSTRIEKPIALEKSKSSSMNAG
ncbi:transposase and inactivated derivative [Paenibacillus popilliae ATCC 14706]|uniref:Transposase and inactivated derivative n=1 Tax=Paenibacillus popilliae ATCC 14706 TaxID=1212764 RepID=M9LDA5_PAEPP|nr:transposase and inactivated derivative [Paenibacillus popilliae ATCC 14706]